MKLFIYSQLLKEKDIEYVSELLSVIKNNDIKLSISSSYAEQLEGSTLDLPPYNKVTSYEELIAERPDKGVLKGDYYTEDRSLLALECNLPLFVDLPYALNDFTLHKRDTSSMITIHTYVDGNFLNSYWADGLVVSTATGSTGYSLS